MNFADNEFWKDVFETRINCGLDYVWITDPNKHLDETKDVKYFIKKVEWDRIVVSHKDKCETIPYENLFEVYDYDAEGVPYIMLKINKKG